MKRIPLLLTLTLLLTLLAACGTTSSKQPPKNKAKEKPARAASLDDLGKKLVQAIQRNDEASAFTLLPTQAEMSQAGFADFATAQGYKKFLAKRRRGFARVTAKYRRKYPGGCKRLEYSRMKKGDSKKIGKITAIRSIDLFAKCDGREIWLADPDMLIQLPSGWKLLEFS